MNDLTMQRCLIAAEFMEFKDPYVLGEGSLTIETPYPKDREHKGKLDVTVCLYSVKAEAAEIIARMTTMAGFGTHVRFKFKNIYNMEGEPGNVDIYVRLDSTTALQGSMNGRPVHQPMFLCKYIKSDKGEFRIDGVNYDVR